MINQKHFDRVRRLIDPMKLVAGGQVQEETLRIAPTVLADVTAEDPVMQEEIFGPILPIIPVKDIEEAIRFVQKRPKPLALYVFTEDKRTEQRVLTETSYGGGCINVPSFIWQLPRWALAALATAVWVLIMERKALICSAMRRAL